MSKTLLTSASVILAALLAMPLTATEGEKVAEGEYVMETIVRDGDRSETFRYVEFWTLWGGRGGFEIESKTDVRIGETGPGYEDLRFHGKLSPALRPLVFEMSGRVPGLEQRGEMTLELLPGELRWRARSGRTDQTENAKLAIDSPYDVFFWSPWFLSSIVRQKSTVPGERFASQVVYIDDDDPIDLIPAKLDVQYLGLDKVTVGTNQFEVHKFELSPGELSPGLVVWISADGLLLAMEDAKKPEQRMELKRFEKYAEFGPGVE